MEIEFTLIALEDLNYFKKSGNQSVLKKNPKPIRKYSINTLYWNWQT